MTDLVARRVFLPAMLSVEEFEAESSQAMGVRSPDAVAEKVSTSAQHALVCGWVEIRCVLSRIENALPSTHSHSLCLMHPSRPSQPCQFSCTLPLSNPLVCNARTALIMIWGTAYYHHNLTPSSVALSTHFLLPYSQHVSVGASSPSHTHTLSAVMVALHVRTCILFERPYGC